MGGPGKLAVRKHQELRFGYVILRKPVGHSVEMLSRHLYMRLEFGGSTVCRDESGSHRDIKAFEATRLNEATGGVSEMEKRPMAEPKGESAG